ncbi:dTDP-4-dehydrorhamnose reductase [Nisaea sp.]|uniref:dTDP-4-dehydrorhamnose reductase n=1 Tax=Nisaea sp. TaxID=2024842 RepID=UPI003B51BC6E
MILVTGAGGQVGTELLARAGKHGQEATGLLRADLDISDAQAVHAAVKAAQPSLIVNAAAYTAVDKAEEDRDAAYAINRDGPANLAAAAKDAGIPLIHISTDYVFDGSKDGAWLERDPVAPLGVYGASKEAGEQAVRAALNEHVIMRTSWVYAAHGGNFVKTMLRVGKERDELRVVADQFGAPTSAGDIADAILTIATRIRDGETDGWGTYHFTAEGRTSWHGFAEAIFARAEKVWGRRPSVAPIPSSEYPTPAKRPGNSVLDCAKIIAAFDVPRRNWQDGLDEVLEVLLAEE